MIVSEKSDAQYKSADLQTIFNSIFMVSENTELLTGAAEPVYEPAREVGCLNKIVSSHDYFASALHEISHWCIAGVKRRALLDYGYWYQPDGRNDGQQLEFEEVEIKPQSMEWIFSMSCGYPFRLSIDNINSPEVKASGKFKENVYRQTRQYMKEGLPSRADIFARALLNFYRPDCKNLQLCEFSLAELR